MHSVLLYAVLLYDTKCLSVLHSTPLSTQFLNRASRMPSAHKHIKANVDGEAMEYGRWATMV